MSKMRIHYDAKGLFVALQEVMPATAMYMEVDTSGDDVAPFGIDNVLACNLYGLVAEGDNLAIVKRYCSAGYPTLWRKNLGICDVCEHVTQFSV